MVFNSNILFNRQCNSKLLSVTWTVHNAELLSIEQKCQISSATLFLKNKKVETRLPTILLKGKKSQKKQKTNKKGTRNYNNNLRKKKIIRWTKTVL